MKKRLLSKALIIALGLLGFVGVAAEPTLIQQARQMHAEGQTEQAVFLLLTQAKDEDPRTALECYRVASTLSPNFAPAQAAYGHALIRNSQFATARTILEEALSLGASGDSVRLLLAGVYWELGELEKADDLYSSLLRGQSSQSAEAAAALGSLRVWLGKPQEALVPLELAMKAYPTDSSIRFDYAQALEADGQHEAALKHYRSLIKESPNSLGPLYRYARLLARTGQRESAQRAMQQYREAYLEDQQAANLRQRAQAALDRGYQFKNNGDLNAALQSFRSADVLPEAHLAIASIYIDQNNPKQAREVLNQAILRWPDEPGIRRALSQISRLPTP